MKPDLARLEAQHEALIAALDCNDLAAIGAASRDLEEGLSGLRRFDAWQIDPELKLAAERISRLADAAARRINVLHDHARQRSAALASLRGHEPAAVYTR